MRELKRCEEEEAFLVRERIAAQKWFVEEWKTVNEAIELAGALLLPFSQIRI